MAIQYYPIWRKQYFFHSGATAHASLYNIYTPYSLLTKIVWFTWRNSVLLRRLFTCPADELPIPCEIVNKEFGTMEDWIWVMNRGTFPEEKKYSALFLHKKSKKVLFLKYAATPKGIAMLENEIEKLADVSGKGLAPALLKKCQANDVAYFITEAVNGKKLLSQSLDEDVFNFLVQVHASHEKVQQKGQLLQVFSHGDFCPWNLMYENDRIVGIDWERAGYFELGYDLLTYIFQTKFLLRSKQPVMALLKENRETINRFFALHGIVDWQPYLQVFCQRKAMEFGGRVEEAMFNDLANVAKQNN